MRPGFRVGCCVLTLWRDVGRMDGISWHEATKMNNELCVCVCVCMCVIALGMREREDEMGEQKENEKRKKGKKCGSPAGN
jgi:hypothetical protein